MAAVNKQDGQIVFPLEGCAKTPRIQFSVTSATIELPKICKMKHVHCHDPVTISNSDYIYRRNHVGFFLYNSLAKSNIDNL